MTDEEIVEAVARALYDELLGDYPQSWSDPKTKKHCLDVGAVALKAARPIIRAQLIEELRASLHGTGQEMHRYGNAMLDAFTAEQEGEGG